MTVERYDINIEGIKVMIAAFAPAGEGGRREWHATFEPDESLRGATFRTCLLRVETAFRKIALDFLPATAVITFSRAYLSDIHNQWDELQKSSLRVFSTIGQPPLSGAKMALMCWFQENVFIDGEERYPLIRHGVYSDVWLDFAPPSRSSREASTMGLDIFRDIVAEAGGSIPANAVRTWFFVRDIDTNYRGVVEARNKIFQMQGLTPSTHYIASTGIGGDSVFRTETADTRAESAALTFTGYAVIPLAEGQMTYLRALHRMSPTHLYGVAFERATAVDYGDRRHIFISGTASIDSEGKVLHIGDVERQTLRMLGNVEALLGEGGAAWDDVMHAVVYLRDIADFSVVKATVAEALPGVPLVIVHGSVCRPEWLVEIECMAITPHTSAYPNF